MIRAKAKILFLYCVPLLLFSGCYKKDLEEFKQAGYAYQPDIVFPLFYTTLTVEDSIPLNIPDLKLSDTVKVNLSPGNFIDGNLKQEIEYVELKLVTINNFPTKGTLQLYFADENGTIQDSLFSINTTAQYQSNGNTYNYSTILIYMDAEKYSKIQTASKIYIAYALSTKNFSSYTPNTLEISAGIRFGFYTTGKK